MSTCCIPLCKGRGKKSCFSVPKTKSALKLWQDALGLDLKPNKRICEKHFKNEDIIRTWVSGQGFNKYTIYLKKARLRDGAIPYISSEYTNDYLLNSTTSGFIISPRSENKKLPEIEHLHNSIYHDHRYSINLSKSSKTDNNDKSNITSDQSTSLISKYITVQSIDLINIPPKWFSDVSGKINNKIVAFHKLGPFREDFVRSIEKQIVLTKDLNILLHVYGKEISIKDIGLSLDYKIDSIDDIENLIKKFDKIKVCQGSMSSNKHKDLNLTFGSKFVDSFGYWRHINCIIILNESSNKNMCLFCKRLWYSLRSNQYRSKIRKCLLPNKKKF